MCFPRRRAMLAHGCVVGFSARGAWRGATLLDPQGDDVFFVLAHILDQLAVGHELESDRRAPRPCVELDVVERELDLEVSEVQPPAAFRQWDRGGGGRA